MGKIGSSLQSSMSGQMNPTNMARSAYGSTSPTSGYTQESANMPMAYGPGGTQSPYQNNPYMYQLYGSNQAPLTGYGMTNPEMPQYSRQDIASAIMASPIGQKFGFGLPRNY